MLNLNYKSEIQRMSKHIFKIGNIEDIINYINNSKIIKLLPFYKLRDNPDLNCSDFIRLITEVKYLYDEELLIYFIENISPVHIENYIRGNMPRIIVFSFQALVFIVRNCKYFILDSKGELNIRLINILIEKKCGRPEHIVKYISQNKYMTCELFEKFHKAFPGLRYDILLFMLRKDITPRFVDKFRSYLYIDENLAALCENPKLTPEMLFDPKHEKYFRLVDEDNKFSNIIARQTWSKRIIHHLYIKTDFLDRISNINYYIFKFKLRYDLEFKHPNYQLYQQRQLYLTRENFHYTTEVNVRKFIVLRLHTRRFPIQIELLLIILTLSLY
jgi:hypothetical protein